MLVVSCESVKPVIQTSSLGSDNNLGSLNDGHIEMDQQDLVF